MTKAKTLDKPDRVKHVRSFLSDSMDDYIASRVLFSAQLPQQAAILASTAIEKALKAVLALRGNECHGHLQKAHWNGLKNFDPALYEKLNPDFLKLNQKAYSLRYTDDLPPSFNLVIATREFLAELDVTMASIQTKFKFEEKGKTRHTQYQNLVSTRDPRLLSENHLFSGEPKEDFIYNTPQFIYEVRSDGARGLFEVTYWSDTPAKAPGFLRPGFVPQGTDHMSYDLSHLPLLGKDA
jgi:hypothetical protein